MTKRLIAVAAAAVLALGMIAFTPTPVAAGPPSGQVKCVFSDGRDIRPEQFSNGRELGRLLWSCVKQGGRPLITFK